MWSCLKKYIPCDHWAIHFSFFILFNLWDIKWWSEPLKLFTWSNTTIYSNLSHWSFSNLEIFKKKKCSSIDFHLWIYVGPTTMILTIDFLWNIENNDGYKFQALIHCRSQEIIEKLSTIGYLKFYFKQLLVLPNRLFLNLYFKSPHLNHYNTYLYHKDRFAKQALSIWEYLRNQLPGDILWIISQSTILQNLKRKMPVQTALYHMLYLKGR